MHTDLYLDPRTGGHTYSVIVFLGDDLSSFPEHGYSPEYFAANSEHVVMIGKHVYRSEAAAAAMHT
jgi:hypothetical protein